MGIFVPRPELEPGETVVSALAANHTQGIRAVGGRLFLTDRSLRFVANRFDRLLRGHDLAIPRGDVESASAAERSLEGGPFTGGVRRRLAVAAGGQEELFVVNRVEEVAAQIDAWASEASP